MRFALVTVLVLGSGCVDQDGDHPDAALAYAQIDLACSDVEVVATPACGGKQCWTEFLATGCGQAAQYDCPDSVCERTQYTSVASTVTINGDAFVPAGLELCHSGIAEGQSFYGVDLLAPTGVGLRIVRNADLTFEAVATDVGGAHSPPLDGCVAASLIPGEGSNDDYAEGSAALTGDATVDCEVDGVTSTGGDWIVHGDISFVGCH